MMKWSTQADTAAKNPMKGEQQQKLAVGDVLAPPSIDAQYEGLGFLDRLVRSFEDVH